MIARDLARLSAGLALLCLAASAHEREFTQSRDWFLPYKGEHEFELRNYIDTSNGGYKGQVEYEYGVTDWFAVEPGFEIIEKEDGKFEAEAAELELRFHWLEFAYERWLPALNVEYEHPFEDEPGEEPAFELKSVLSRYGENGMDFTVNLNVGKQLAGEKESESELTAGMILPLGGDGGAAGWHQGGRVGVEALDDFRHGDVRAGPLFVYRATSHWNFLTSYMFGVNDRDGSNFDQLTVILEFEL
jgi:hypothetical protein